MTQLFSVLMLVSFSAIAAEIHQWKDKEGNVHFGDRPPEHLNSSTVELRPNIYQSSGSALEQDTADQATAPAVTLYSTAWCGYCTKARNYFRRQNIPFREYDVEKSRKGQRDYARFGAAGVPVILVGDRRLQGFSVAAFESAYKR